MLDQPQRLDERHAFVHHLSGRRRAAGPQSVDAAQFERAHPEFPGQLIHQRLHGEGRLGDAEAPHCPAGDVVGVDRESLDAHVGDVVGAGGEERRLVEHRDTRAGVGAGVGQDVAGQGHQSAVAGRAQAGGVLHRVALGVEAQTLGPLQHHLDRSPGVIGRQRQVGVQAHIVARAKAATWGDVHQAYLLRRQPQHLDHSTVMECDRLARHPDGDHTILLAHSLRDGGVPCCHAGLRLQIGVLDEWGAESALDDHIRPGHRCFDVALFDVGAVHHVAGLIARARWVENGCVRR